MQSVPQFANHQNATLHAKNQRMPFATSSANAQTVTSCALIRLARQKNAQNASPYAKPHTVSLTANHQNLSVKQYAKNLNVIGNAQSLSAQSLSASLSVKTQDADQKLNAANATNKTFT